MEQLGHQRTVGFEVFAREVHRQSDQILDAGCVGRSDTRQVGGHIRNHDIHSLDPALDQRPLQLGQHLGLTEIALDEMHPFNSVHGQQVQRDDLPVQFPDRRAIGAQAPAHILAPGARGGPQVNHHITRVDQPEGFVDLLELVRRTRPVTVLLGQLDIGVVDVLVQPRLVDLLALSLDFHAHGETGAASHRRVNDNCPMPQIQLTPAQRKVHRAEAHHLDPVVLIGGDGLTAAVKKEVDAALKAHGLIKVRVFSDNRTAREAMLQTLTEELDAAPIQHIGKLLVLWRPLPEKVKVVDEDRMAGPRDVKVLKFSKRGGQKPEVKVVRVLGNQRLTSGGQVKRAKVLKKSVKKSAR